MPWSLWPLTAVRFIRRPNSFATGKNYLRLLAKLSVWGELGWVPRLILPVPSLGKAKMMMAHPSFSLLAVSSPSFLDADVTNPRIPRTKKHDYIARSILSVCFGRQQNHVFLTELVSQMTLYAHGPHVQPVDQLKIINYYLGKKDDMIFWKKEV